MIGSRRAEQLEKFANALKKYVARHPSLRRLSVHYLVLKEGYLSLTLHAQKLLV